MVISTNLDWRISEETKYIVAKIIWWYSAYHLYKSAYQIDTDVKMTIRRRTEAPSTWNLKSSFRI